MAADAALFLVLLAVISVSRKEYGKPLMRRCDTLRSGSNLYRAIPSNSGTSQTSAICSVYCRSFSGQCMPFTSVSLRKVGNKVMSS